MGSVNNIVLIIPGKDDLQAGPEPGWLEHLGTNLEMVLKRFTPAGIRTLSPDSGNAAEVLGNAGILIPVMHNAYPAGGKYLGFLEKTLAGNVDMSGGLVLLNTSPVNEVQYPFIPPDTASVEMYEVTGDNVLLPGEGSGTYWSRLLDLVSEIKALGSAGPDPATRERTVYLAQASGDMTLIREILKRELVEQGYGVVPVPSLLNREGDLKSRVQNLLDRSVLAVHLLGNEYGVVMDETGLSLAETQIQIVSETLEAIEKNPVSGGQKISRLIWIDPEFNPVDQKQEEFISRLKKNLENLHGTEIIQTPLESFKTLVINKMKKVNAGSAQSAGGEGNEGFLYLVHSPDDQAEAKEFSGDLQKEGLLTRMLNYEGDQQRLLNDHKQFLRECEGALVYYGRPNRTWLRSKVLDLLKAPGLGRAYPLQTRQVFAAQKDLLEDYTPPGGISVIRQAESGKAIAEILKTLKP